MHEPPNTRKRPAYIHDSLCFLIGGNLDAPGGRWQFLVLPLICALKGADCTITLSGALQDWDCSRRQPNASRLRSQQRSRPPREGYPGRGRRHEVSCDNDA